MSELATILSSIALSLRNEAETLEDLAGIQRNRADLVRELIATLRESDRRKEPIPPDPVHQSMGKVKW